MRSSEVMQSIKFLTGINEIPLVLGAPGCGKTETAIQAGNEAGYYVPAPLYLAIYDPVDSQGVPYVAADPNNTREKITKWAKSALLSFPDDKPVMVILDEVDKLNNSQQSLVAQLILARRVGDIVIPPNVRFVLIGNRQKDRAGGQALHSHLLDRCVALHYEANLKDWSTYALQHNVHPTVFAFNQFRPDYLSQGDDDKLLAPGKHGQSPRYTPRGAMKVSAMEHAGLPEHLAHEVIAGKQGESYATEYVAFRRVQADMPNLDNCILHPESAPVPKKDKPAVLYALSVGLAYKATPDNFDRVITYIKRLQPVYNILCISAAIRKNEKLANTHAFNTWCATDGNELVL